MRPSITNRRLAKVRFFAVYSISVLLILLLVSSFIKNSGANEAGLAASEKKLAGIDALLHRRWEPLQAATLAWAESGDGNKAKAMDETKRLFQASVDSVRKSNADLADLQEKAAVLRLLNTFTESADREGKIAASVAARRSTGGNIANPAQKANDTGQWQNLLAQKEAEMAAMKEENEKVLAEKNRTIAALQANNAGQGTTKTDGATNEWKDRYNRLKSSADRTASQLQALKTSYKEVVDDNRRLIAQLQNARAGKN